MCSDTHVENEITRSPKMLGFCPNVYYYTTPHTFRTAFVHGTCCASMHTYTCTYIHKWAQISMHVRTYIIRSQVGGRTLTRPLSSHNNKWEICFFLGVCVCINICVYVCIIYMYVNVYMINLRGLYELFIHKLKPPPYPTTTVSISFDIYIFMHMYVYVYVVKCVCKYYVCT